MNVEIKMNLPPDESKLPKNVKQIGNIEENFTNVYLEDYVYTYLYQIARSDLSEGKVALLVGEKHTYKGQEVVIVSGAIQGKFIDIEDNKTVFTVKTWDDAKKELKKYFSNRTIVGWMCSQPGYGDFLTKNHQEVHKQYFSNDNQILLLIDPVEKDEKIYVWKQDKMNLLEGYFIYYERNNEMHRYMLDNKIESNQDRTLEHKVDTSIASSYRSKVIARKEDEHIKKLTNMLISLSAALFVFCIIMGISLIQNDKRLSELEVKYNNLYKSALSNDTIAEQLEDKLSANNQENEDQPRDDVENVNESIRDDSSEDVDINIKNDTETNTDASTENDVDSVPSVDVEQTNSEADTIIYDVPDHYIIKPGDNLNSISLKFYDTLDMAKKIKEVNNITNVNKIYAGQKLVLPKN